MDDSEEWEDEVHVVIDNGTALIKSGVGGDDRPTSRTPTLIAQSAACNNDDAAREVIKYPMKNGIITSPDDMELIWYHVFKHELKVNPSEHKVLLTDTAQNPRSNREKMMEIMFETFNVKATFTEDQAVLSLYAHGRTTGVVLSLGDGVALSMPVYEGYCIPSAVRRTNFAGREITDYLAQLLNEKGYAFSTSVEREIARDIKEKHGYIAMDYKAEIDKWESSVGQTEMERKYVLPDGKQISLNVERFKCAELLFQPELFGIDEKSGIHQVLYESIKASDVDTRREICSRIVLSGGTTLMPGFATRLKAELSGLMKKGGIEQLRRMPKLLEPLGRLGSAWLGGSILVSLSAFNEDDGWIERKEYDENGGARAMNIHKNRAFV